jgi:hypothetical protein
LVSKLSKNPQILKDYIDWVYLNVVPQAKRRLTSISFLTKEEVITHYKINILLATQTQTTFDRSTDLPSPMKTILQQNGFNVQTYGDLAFLTQLTPPPANLQDCLAGLGLDPEILRKIV